MFSRTQRPPCAPAASLISRPGLQISRVLLADERYAKKIAVRYAAVVLKAMSAHRLSLPRATYGGAHHRLIAPPHAAALLERRCGVELVRSAPPKQNSTSDAERAPLVRSPRHRRGKPQRRREPRWPTRCSRRRTEPAAREEREGPHAQHTAGHRLAPRERRARRTAQSSNVSSHR